MSNNRIDKEVFEVHITNMYKQLENLNDTISKLYDRQDQMNVTLAKNTVVVKEHHIRSTRLEEVQEQMLLTIQKINNELLNVQREVHSIETDIKPIKKHVSAVKRTFEFLGNLPKGIKWLATVAVGSIFVIGVIKGTIQLGDILKVLLK